jgi:hypothetical protein
MRQSVRSLFQKAARSQKSSRRAPRSRFSNLERLEDRLALAVDIQFDDRFDTNGWFDPDTTAGRERLDALEQAKDDLLRPLLDTLDAISPSTGNTWSVTITNPQTGAPEPLAPDFSVPANTIIVYIGSGTHISGDGRASGASWSSTNGTQAWFDTIRGRGEPDALLDAPKDVAPFAGSITFHTNSPWNYDNEATTGDNFYSVAQHELAHLLGFGAGSGDNLTSWNTFTSGNNFTGPKATAAFGSQIPIGTGGTGAHFADSVMHSGQRVNMTETGDGSNRGFTPIDYAALDDLGWDLAEKIDGPDPVIIDTASGRNVTVAIAATPHVAPPATSTDDLWYEAEFNGRLYRSLVDANDAGRIYIEFSTDDGNTFGNRFTTNDYGSVNPALTVADGHLYIAWTGTDKVINVAQVVIGPNGVATNFDMRETTGYTSDYAPALETYGTALVLAHTGTDDRVLVDVKDFYGPNTTWGPVYDTGETSEQSPVMTNFNGSVYLAYVGTDDTLVLLQVQMLQQVVQPLQIVANNGGAGHIDGDQRGVNYDDSIDIDRTPAGGVKITFNGEVKEYAPGDLTSLTINTGSGHNTVRILSQLNNVPITVNGNGWDTINFGSGLPTPTYSPNANGILGWGTLNVGGQQVHHKGVEYVPGISPDLSGFVLTSATINENGVATVTGTFIDAGSYSSHSAGINWGDGTTTPLGRLTLGDRSFTFTHQYRDDNPTGTSSDTYAITATLTDNENRSDSASASLTVNNVAPQLSGVVVTSSINENGTVTLSGTVSDVGTLDSSTLVINWGEGATQTISLPAGTAAFSTTHQYKDDNPTGTSSDVYTIGLTLTDDDTGSATRNVTTTVNNLAPVITAHDNSNPQSNKAKEGQTITINGSFTDVGTLDTHVAQIDWGDGTVGVGAVTETNGSGTFSAAHAFNRGGIFAVTTTVRDDDGGTTTAVETIFVTGAGISTIGGKRVLFVVGTDVMDTVTLVQANSTIYLTANFLNAPGGLRTFNAANVDEIRIYLGAGNDVSVVAGQITSPVLVDGGLGDDTLTNDANTGGFGSVLLGGDGKDVIVGTNARDIIIGGDGADTIAAINGQDLIIGSYTTFDSGVADDNVLAQQAALLSVLSEWNSTQSIAVRRANLLGTGTGTNFTNRRNGSNFFRLNETVFDDLDKDIVTGGVPDADWFLLFGNDLAADFFASFGDLNGF